MMGHHKIFKYRMMALLQELASKSYQTRVWVEGKAADKDHSISFTEAVIQLFDDALVTSAIEEGAIIYDKKITKALYELSDAVDLVEDYRSSEEIINDPLMQRVREKAAEILELIAKSDKSENTVTFIEEGTLKMLEP